MAKSASRGKIGDVGRAAKKPRSKAQQNQDQAYIAATRAGYKFGSSG